MARHATRATVALLLFCFVCSVEVLRGVRVTGNKGRVLPLNLNLLFAKYCIPPSVDVSLPFYLAEPLCSVVLTQEPKRGDIFASSTSGTEIHVNDTAFTADNLWEYAEETYTSPDDRDDSDKDPYGGEEWEKRRDRVSAAMSAKYHSADIFDLFRVNIFHPPDASQPSAEANVTIRIINHKPIALNTTLVLRVQDDWTTSDTGGDPKYWYFPRSLLLVGYDADTSAENPDEVSAVVNMTFEHFPTPDMIGSFTDNARNSISLSSTANDPFSTFLSLKASPPTANFLITFGVVDAEQQVSSQRGATQVFLVPNGDSYLPGAPRRGGPEGTTSYSNVVPRVFGIPTLVLCRYLNGGTTHTDCNFRLFGGDLLSYGSSMSWLGTKADPVELVASDFVKIRPELSAQSDTEGSYRLAPFNKQGKGENDQQFASGYYPVYPSQLVTSPLFSAPYVLSDVTKDSPPDVVATQWNAIVNESGLRSKKEQLYRSAPVDLKVYSTFLEPPQLKCSNSLFRWAVQVLVPPVICSESSEYDDSCLKAASAPHEQVLPIIDPFRVEFAQSDLNRYVWQKDHEVAYVVLEVTMDEDLTNHQFGTGGCFFHSLLFREMVPGDYFTSESDLTWLPFSASPTGKLADVFDVGDPLCSFQHKKMTVALIVGSTIGCKFNISAPLEDLPPGMQSDWNRVMVTEEFFDKSVLMQNEEGTSEGIAVIPFALHRAVKEMANRSARGAGIPLPIDVFASLTLTPNVAAHGIMTSYSNGPLTYPQELVVPVQDFISVPVDAFSVAQIDPATSQEPSRWLSGVRRQLVAVVTAGAGSLLHRHRSVSFRVSKVSGTMPKSSFTQDWIRVRLSREANTPPTIRRVSEECEDGGGSNQFDALSNPARFLLGRRLQKSLLPTRGVQWIDRTILSDALRRRLEAAYEVFVARNYPETVWISSSDEDYDNLRLVVTRVPKFVRLSPTSDVDLQDWVKAVRNNTLVVTDIELGKSGCASLRLDVTAPQETIDSAPGETSEYADDELRVAVTDGVSLSAEILLRLRVRKSSGQAPDAFSSQAVRQWDMPLIIVSGLFLSAVLLYYRRKIRRLVHAREAASDSTEDVEEEQQQRVAKATAVFKSIRSMVASKVAFTRVTAKVGNDLSDEDERAMEPKDSKVVLDEDEWTNWEDNSCAPHPTVVKQLATTSMHPPPPPPPQVSITQHDEQAVVEPAKVLAVVAKKPLGKAD